MIIGQENYQPQNLNKARVNSAQYNYNKLRLQDRQKDAKFGNKINFGMDYNKPLLKQYGVNQVPGPNHYVPKFESIEAKKDKRQTFTRQKRMYSEASNKDIPSVFDYNTNLNGIKYNEKRAVSFAKSSRINCSNPDLPGVGAYTTNKQYDLNKGHGVRIPQSNYKGPSTRVQTPGVGAYQVKRETFKPNYPKFSNDERFKGNMSQSGSSNTIIPGVGNYNIEKSYNKTSFKGNSHAGKGGVIPTQSRFTKRLNQVIDGPSPFDYSIPGHFDQLKRNKLKSSIHLRRNNNPINIIV